jgi:hypothetical protein
MNELNALLSFKQKRGGRQAGKRIANNLIESTTFKEQNIKLP